MRVPCLLLFVFASVEVVPSWGFATPRATSVKSRAVPSPSHLSFYKECNVEATHPRVLAFSDRALQATSSDTTDEKTTPGGVLGYLRSLDVPLLLYFAVWYARNYYVSLSPSRVSFEVSYMD